MPSPNSSNDNRSHNTQNNQSFTESFKKSVQPNSTAANQNKEAVEVQKNEPVEIQSNEAVAEAAIENQNSSLDISFLGTWFLLAFAALLPIIIVPFSNNFIAHSKLFFILFGAILAALLFFVNSFKQQVWKFIVSPITLPLIIFGLAVTASIFFTQNYPVKNLLGMGGAYLSAILIALFGSSLIKQDKADKLLPVLVASICVVNLGSLLQLFGFGPTHLINAVSPFELEHNLLFNLSSSSFIAIQIGIIALVGTIIQIVNTKKITTFSVITLPILVLGLGLHLWSIMPGQAAAVTLPPATVGWSIALDSLRVPRSALIGQGPEGYANAFARYKPIWMNTDKYWQFNFGSAMGMPLSTIVQLGLLGLIAWLLIVLRFFAKLKDYQVVKKSPLTWMLGASLLMQFVLPPNYVLIGLQGALFAFWIARFKDEFFTLKLRALNASLEDNKVDSRIVATQKEQRSEKIISLGINGAIIAALIVLLFSTGRAYASFNQLYQANKAFMENNGTAVYEHQRQAVLLNPYLDSNRRSYALTNLQIAIALSNKADLTEQEQEQISLLIQQAVREAQAATAIDPLDSQNWLVLAQIYQELIGSIEEADQWAVNAYVEALQNNPTDPLLRIQLGNILLEQEQIQQAANLFAQATELKPDLAAGYFYLGHAQLAAQNPVQAQQSWQQALALLDPNSEDYGALEELLEEIEPQVQQMLEAQEQQMQQDSESALGRELPSLTDQNIEGGEAAISEPGTEPLELSPEDEELIRQSQQPEDELDQDMIESEPETEEEEESEELLLEE